MQRYRILCLDGGGIRGVFSASVLATLERVTGRSCLRHFDLMVGTSTGGIIALALALGHSASEIRDFYVECGPKIFPSMGVMAKVCLLRQLVAPKRSRSVLREVLVGILGDKRLSDAECRLVLPTYDSVAGRIYLLKTAHKGNFGLDIDALAVDCALATSAAPTYYSSSPFPIHAGASYIDGGVWANCPVLVALVEALRFLEIPAENIDLLSIGTVGHPFSVSGSRRTGGVLQWNSGLLEVLMRGQAESALAIGQLLLGSGKVHRIDASVEPGRFSLDDSSGISDLIALGDAEARKRLNLNIVENVFLNDREVAPFVDGVGG
jgi:uncharacterized protein